MENLKPEDLKRLTPPDNWGWYSETARRYYIERQFALGYDIPLWLLDEAKKLGIHYELD